MSIYLKNLFELENKVAIVTGSCGQLGVATCESLLKSKCKVVGVDKELDDNKINGVDYKKLDISEELSVSNFFDETVRAYGKIDILINNAGVSVFEPFEERNVESLDFVYNVNLKGTFFCIKHFARIVKKYKIENTSIVNIASIYGKISPDFRIYGDNDRKNSEIYGATKAGVIQMTKYFSVHLSDIGIRVNSVSPGGIFNPKSPQSENFINEYSRRNPMGRMANTDEILGAILYLSSKASSYTNGHNLIVDGGMCAW